MREFLSQHWQPLLVAALFLTALGTVAYRLLAGTLRGAILALRQPKQLGESGAAAAEFVIVVIPFMLMLTALMQLALASMGRVMVSYAAFCAARAAMVFVPMTSDELGSGSGSTSAVGTAVNDEGANNVGYGAGTRTDFSISQKASLMRNAAAYALIPASPSIDVVATDIANNFPSYLEQRLLHGLNPLNYLQSILGDLTAVPAALMDNIADQLKQAVQGGLDTPAQKQAAIQRLDSWLDGAMQGNPAAKAQVESAVNGYINNYQGSAESPTGQLGDLVQNTITSTLSGPLEQFKDQVQNSVSGAMGSVGGSFNGYAVDRALDAGFGSGTDGAGGAILRSLRKLVYARIGTAVTLLDEHGNFKSKFEWNDQIHVRVTYLFYCQIPLANRFAGHAFYDLPNNTVSDLATGPLKGFEIIGIPGYFMTMTADHTVTNQGKPE